MNFTPLTDWTCADQESPTHLVTVWHFECWGSAHQSPCLAVKLHSVISRETGGIVRWFHAGKTIPDVGAPEYTRRALRWCANTFWNENENVTESVKRGQIHRRRRTKAQQGKHVLLRLRCENWIKGKTDFSCKETPVTHSPGVGFGAAQVTLLGLAAFRMQ